MLTSGQHVAGFFRCCLLDARTNNTYFWCFFNGLFCGHKKFSIFSVFSSLDYLSLAFSASQRMLFEFVAYRPFLLLSGRYGVSFTTKIRVMIQRVPMLIVPKRVLMVRKKKTRLLSDPATTTIRGGLCFRYGTFYLRAIYAQHRKASATVCDLP